jgi:hypothetical protein
VARVLAIGQEAVGVVAIGQYATGVVAIGEVATGVIAIGMVARGVFAIGMAAFGVCAFGIGAVGVAWSSAVVAIGGRVGIGWIKLPLVPRVPRPLTATWAGIASAQLAGLVAATIAFWAYVGVPLGDALVGVLNTAFAT